MSEKNEVTGGIIGELILGELPFWQVGVCVVKHDGEDMVVYGENDKPVARICLSDHQKESELVFEELGDDPENPPLVVDTQAVTELVNDAIEAEHDGL